MSLLTLQAALSNTLQTSLQQFILETAFKANPRSDIVATRFAEYYIRNGERQEAEEVLDECREQNPASKRVHLELAKMFLGLTKKGTKRLFRII